MSRTTNPLLVLALVSFALVGCGSQVEPEAETPPSVPITTSTPDAAPSTPSADPSPTTATPTPEPTTPKPAPAPPAETTETTKAAAPKPEPASDPAARALELRDMFRADHEALVAQAGGETSCYDDEVASEDTMALSTCFLADGGVVLFVAVEDAADLDGLATEFMNGEIPYTTCVGDDYVVATSGMVGVDLVAESMDCRFS